MALHPGKHRREGPGRRDRRHHGQGCTAGRLNYTATRRPVLWGGDGDPLIGQSHRPVLFYRPVRRMMETTPVPEYQFTGWFVPAEAIYLLRDGELNATEVILLVTIDSLVPRKPGARGCFCSNATLAKYIGVNSTDHVSRMVSKLVGMKLVTQVGFDGRKRYLETKWHKVTETPPQSSLGICAEAGYAQKPTRQVLPYSTNTVRVPSERRTEEEKQVPFNRPVPSNPITEEATELAQILIKAVKDAGQVKTPYWLTTWAKHIQHLITTDAVPTARVRTVLAWYSQNITGTYTPRAYSGETFRKKFLQIEAAMQRHQPALTVFVPGDHAIALATLLQRNQWPTTADLPHLPNAIQASITNYTVIRNHIYGLTTKTTRLGKLALHVYETMPPVRTMVDAWWDDVYRSVAKLDKWAGKFDKFVLTATHKNFQRQYTEWCQGWCHDAQLHKELLEQLTDENRT